MAKTVLVIDNENLPMVYYERALKRSGYEIARCRGTDEVLGALDETDPAAIVLDIMIPPGETYRGYDTDDGMKTGIILYEEIRKRRADVPMVVLTSVCDPEILGYFKEGPRLRVAQKIHYPPEDLAELVRELIEEGG